MIKTLILSTLLSLISPNPHLKINSYEGKVFSYINFNNIFSQILVNIDNIAELLNAVLSHRYDDLANISDTITPSLLTLSFENLCERYSDHENLVLRSESIKVAGNEILMVDIGIDDKFNVLSKLIAFNEYKYKTIGFERFIYEFGGSVAEKWEDSQEYVLNVDKINSKDEYGNIYLDDGHMDKVFCEYVFGEKQEESFIWVI